MRTTTITPGEERYPAALYLGRVGENLTRQIVFDCSALAEECGAGVAEIVAMTPEGTKYAPANVTQEGSVVTWLISEADVGTAGRGRAELSWIVGDGVAKTITWQTLIRASLTGTDGEDPPDVYKDWVDKITRVGTQAGIDAQSAAASAQAAADSAEGAAGSAANAGESAAEAEESAQRAEDAAGTATTQAERTKELVDGAVDTIQQATTEGVTEVEASGATQSQRLAAQGAAIVEEATEQAGKAQTSEESAQRSATEASQSATTATDKAAEAAQSAQAAQQAQAAAETAQGKAEASATAAGESAQAAAESAETAGEAALGAYVCKTAEGTVVSFDDGAENVPVKSCVVQIEPVQEGSGDPSPDNVRPIRGWTKANVSRAGKNLWSTKNLFVSNYNSAPGATLRTDPTSAVFEPTEGGFRVSTAGEWTGITFVSSPLEKGATYHIGYGATLSGLRTTIYTVDANLIVQRNIRNDTSTQQSESLAITMADGEVYIAICIASATANAVIDVAGPQIELGTTATAYEPYTGTTYPVSWEAEAGTVYGGELDVVTGEMVVDTIEVEYDGAESGWTQSGLYKGSFYRSDPRIESEMSIVRCSHLTAVSNTYGYRYGKCLVDGGHAPFNINLFIFDGSSTLDEFKSYLAEQKSKGTPVIVQYALTTPITYQLTPTEVRTLLGANNIWADCGPLSVTYRADPTILHQKLVDAIISLGGNV